MKSDFIIVLKGFDSYESEKGDAPVRKTRPKKIEATVLYTKLQNSFVINCCLVLIWMLQLNLKLIFLNKLLIFSHVENKWEN